MDKTEINIFLVLSFAIMLIFIIGLIYFVYQYQKRRIIYQKELAEEKVKLQQAQLEKKDAIIEERGRIIADLHDEIGGGLSSIRLITELALQRKTGERELISKISETSKELAQKMSEIVWTLNYKNDSLEGLIGYIRSYIMQTLEDVNINCKANVTSLSEDVIVDGNHRRDIFLIVKEICNNIIKHSHAKNASLQITIEGDVLVICLQDDGVGFDVQNTRPGSFGLSGLKKRVARLKGTIEWSTEKGTSVSIKLPMQNLYALND